nr:MULTISPECIES: DUF3265 domain-containing protein [Vibrio]
MCRTFRRRGGRTFLTNNLRSIQYAWHFYYAFCLVVKVVCGGCGIALLTH